MQCHVQRIGESIHTSLQSAVVLWIDCGANQHKQVQLHLQVDEMYIRPRSTTELSIPGNCLVAQRTHEHCCCTIQCPYLLDLYVHGDQLEQTTCSAGAFDESTPGNWQLGCCKDGRAVHSKLLVA